MVTSAITPMLTASTACLTTPHLIGPTSTQLYWPRGLWTSIGHRLLTIGLASECAHGK